MYLCHAVPLLSLQLTTVSWLPVPQLSLSYREKSRWLLLTDLETILATICLLKLLEPNKLGYVQVTWLLLPPSVTLFSSISLPPLSLFPLIFHCMYNLVLVLRPRSPSTHILKVICVGLVWIWLTLSYLSPSLPAPGMAPPPVPPLQTPPLPVTVKARGRRERFSQVLQRAGTPLFRTPL